MTQELYTELLKILTSYHFDENSNFFTLYDHARKAKMSYIPFRQFVKYAKQLGVYSQLQRIDTRVARRLRYAPSRDEYVGQLAQVSKICDHCQGVGVVYFDIS